MANGWNLRGARAAERYSDSDLIARCRKGDEEAWDALIERYAPLIYSATRRMGLSSDDCADIFQEISLQLLNHLDEVRDDQRLAAWLLTCTRREVWRWRRRHAATIGCLDEECLNKIPADDDPLEERLIALERGFHIRRAVDLLPQRCRTLLTALYLQDPPLTYEEIAVRMKMPVGSVSPTRARCLGRLKKIYEKNEAETYF